jgi:hypothetical protein
LKPALRIYRKTGSGSELLSAHATVHRGDTLQIRYVAAGKHFGVIASLDARGLVTFHLPESAGLAMLSTTTANAPCPTPTSSMIRRASSASFFVTSNAPFTTAEIAQALKKRHPPARSAGFV